MKEKVIVEKEKKIQHLTEEQKVLEFDQIMLKK